MTIALKVPSTLGFRPDDKMKCPFCKGTFCWTVKDSKGKRDTVAMTFHTSPQCRQYTSTDAETFMRSAHKQLVEKRERA